MKYNDGTNWVDLSIKALDSMPVGSIVDYDGQASDIPAGWEQYDGVVLYNSTNGETGNITLSDSAANYSKIEIIFTDNDGYIPPSAIFYNCNGKRIILFEIHWQYMKCKEFSVSGKNLTVEVAGQITLSGSASQGNNYIKILKIIGYK